MDNIEAEHLAKVLRAFGVTDPNLAECKSVDDLRRLRDPGSVEENEETATLRALGLNPRFAHVENEGALRLSALWSKR